jgi:hypothetical protein
MILTDARVKDVHVTEDTISVDLMDGRSITVPLVWYPRLLNASPHLPSGKFAAAATASTGNP